MKTRGPTLVRSMPPTVDLGRLVSAAPQSVLALYRQLLHREPPAGNVEHARRRVARYVQTEQSGGLPESARQFGLGIARNLISSDHYRDGRPHKPNGPTLSSTLPSEYDDRLPMPGSVLVKDYRGKRIVVQVLNEGFEWDGRRFSSLSAVAREVTGTKWNGFAFFGLGDRHGS